MIKLYIFETTEELRAFEAPETITTEVIDEPTDAIARSSFKERIIEKSRKQNRCSLCGERGHRATTCVARKSPKLTQEQIDHIKELSEQGETVAEIAIETGLDEKVVKKHW